MKEKSKLTPGMVLRGARSEYTILDVVSERGGQGGVYKAKDRKGNIWAVKWYWKNDVKQRDRILALCTNGMPPALRQLTDCKFIWPKDMIQNKDSFGYIMELVDLKNYGNFADVILSKTPIDFEVLSKLCINICKGFDKLHSSGFCYKDISGGNIHFSVKDYSVIVMDVDNIRPNVTNGESDVLGTQGFIAPEIIQGKSMPNTKTDRFSIAVMLFCLWCKHNPFVGKKVVLYEGNNELMDLYANPVFIFHPTDKSNTAEKDPNESWAKNCFAWVRAWWEAIPSILKKQFTECFTEELDPNKRNTTESMWITIFERILTEGHLDVCPKCKNKIASESSKCVFCGEKHKPEQPQAPVKKNIGGAQSPVGRQNNAQPQKQTGANNAAPKNNTPVPTPATLKNRIVIDENGSRSNTIDLKVGNVIAGADISSRLASMRKVLEVCTSPNDASLLALRNLTYYAFRVVYKDGTSNMLEPERAVLIRKVEKIILPYDIILYIE